MAVAHCWEVSAQKYLVAVFDLPLPEDIDALWLVLLRNIETRASRREELVLGFSDSSAKVAAICNSKIVGEEPVCGIFGVDFEVDGITIIDTIVGRDRKSQA